MLIGKKELMKWLSILSVLEISSNRNEEYTSYCNKSEIL